MKRISICVLSVLLFLPAQSTAAKAVESSIPICVNTARGTIRYTNSGKCKAKTESLVQMNTDGSPTPALKKFTYQAGDIGPAGGYIFFVDSNDRFPAFTYLEAAPAGWSQNIATSADEIAGTASSDPLVHWCSNVNTLLDDSSWSAAAVGTGKQHTAKAAQTCTSGAITMTDNFSNVVKGKTYSDWFLPSLGEIMLMYTSMRQLGIGGAAPVTYWSSSEIDAEGALVQGFRTGGQGYDLKAILRSVRPIRMFD